jgi:hypothetical protein
MRVVVPGCLGVAKGGTWGAPLGRMRVVARGCLGVAKGGTWDAPLGRMRVVARGCLGVAKGGTWDAPFGRTVWFGSSPSGAPKVHFRRQPTATPWDNRPKSFVALKGRPKRSITSAIPVGILLGVGGVSRLGGGVFHAAGFGGGTRSAQSPLLAAWLRLPYPQIQFS